MRRIILQLTAALIVSFVLLTPTTINSQQAGDSFKSSTIYTIDNDGTLKLYRHSTPTVTTRLPTAGMLTGPSQIGAGWTDYKSVFSGNTMAIYGIKTDGTLVWNGYKTQSPRDPNYDPNQMTWLGPKDVARGWGGFKEVFAGESGIIYAITQEGKLVWYKHNGYLDGRGIESPGAWEGPNEIGSGWNVYKHVFYGGNGIVYAIAYDNRLKWYRHINYLQGAKSWEGPNDVGGPGWGAYKEVFSSGDGILYALTADDKMIWCREHDYLHGIKAWDGPNEITGAWGDFPFVFASISSNLSPAPDTRPRTPADSSINNYGRRNPVLDNVYRNENNSNETQNDNEIRCRGYGGTGGSEYVFFTINSNPRPTGEVVVTYEMAFTPGPNAAGPGGQGLRPGECAFADRPIGEQGPYRIRFETSANALHGSPTDRSATAAERFPDVQTIPAYLKDPNHYWSFFNAKPSGKFFVSTANRYWKPALGLEDRISPSDDVNERRRVLRPTAP